MFSVSTGYKILTWYAFSFEISSKVIFLAGKVLNVTYRPVRTFLNLLTVLLAVAVTMSDDI